MNTEKLKRTRAALERAMSRIDEEIKWNKQFKHMDDIPIVLILVGFVLSLFDLYPRLIAILCIIAGLIVIPVKAYMLKKALQVSEPCLKKRLVVSSIKDLFWGTAFVLPVAIILSTTIAFPNLKTLPEPLCMACILICASFLVAAIITIGYWVVLLFKK